MIDIGELRAVSRLLRELPDPEPPEALRERVMAAVRAEQAGPTPLRPGRWARRHQTGVAAALAAGIAGLVFFASPQGEPFVPAPLASTGDARGTVSHETAAGGKRAERRPVRFRPAAVAAPRPMAFFAGHPLLASSANSPQSLPPLDRRLDRQIDQMLHQPDAFFRRLERIRDSERYLARLADRSARRGDSAAIALRVRNTGHPLAPKLAERFLRASLVHSLSQPRRAAPRSQAGERPSRAPTIYAH